MTGCPAKIRPFPNDTELSCEFGSTGHVEHRAVLRDYAYAGSRTEITWQDTDRRNFTGDWTECVNAPCVLPLGHRGECVS